jgi:predicted DNA-binding transcriptional regulator
MLKFALRAYSTNARKAKVLIKALPMVTLTPDEVALIRSILIALRAINVREIDKAIALKNLKGKGRSPLSSCRESLNL